MKKTFVAMALAAIIPVTVLAASGHGGSHHRGPDVARMAGRLDLSAEQQEKVRALFEAHKAMREAMRERMQASMAEVLTPDQQAKMQSLREERHEKREERRERRKHHRNGKECGSGKGATKS